MAKFSVEAWQLAAQEVLAALVTERYIEEGARHFHRAYYECNLTVGDMPPGKWRTLYAVIADLYGAKKAVNYPNVIASGASIPQDWYFALSALLDDVTRMDYDESIALCKDFGARALAADVFEQAGKDIRNGDDVAHVVRSAIEDITATGGAPIRGETARETGAALEEWLNSTPTPVVSTGLEWLDAEIGGFERNMYYGLVGAYKSRKSTMAYNFILKAARAGESVAVLSLENMRRKMVAIFVAMMAIERIYKQHGGYRADNPLYWFGGESLHRARAAYKTWHAGKVSAIDAAIAEWRALESRIRLYDMTEDGGLKDKSLANVAQVIARDQHLHKGWLYVVDHIGLLEPQIDNAYEQQRRVSNGLREITRRSTEHPVSIIAIAQQNEEAIKGGASGYSAGVKGGGSFSADVDVLIALRPVVETEGKYYNDRAQACIKFQRGGGSTEWNTVMFHPNSGLIMPHDTYVFNELVGSAA